MRYLRQILILLTCKYLAIILAPSTWVDGKGIWDASMGKKNEWKIENLTKSSKKLFAEWERKSIRDIIKKITFNEPELSPSIILIAIEAGNKFDTFRKLVHASRSARFLIKNSSWLVKNQ